MTDEWAGKWYSGDSDEGFAAQAAADQQRAEAIDRLRSAKGWVLATLDEDGHAAMMAVIEKPEGMPELPGVLTGCAFLVWAAQGASQTALDTLRATMARVGVQALTDEVVATCRLCGVDVPLDELVVHLRDVHEEELRDELGEEEG